MQRQELIVSQLAKAGFRVKLTPVAPGQAMQNFLLAARAQGLGAAVMMALAMALTMNPAKRISVPENERVDSANP